jgi:hypothetical protein
MLDTIPLAFQSYDSAYDWWVPNTILSGSFDAVKGPATHSTAWFDENGNAKRHDQMCGHPHAPWVLLSTIPRGQRYIYPVMLIEREYFERHAEQGFRHVDPRVIEDVRAGLARIVLLMCMEGSSGATGRYPRDQFILDSWCRAAGLEKHMVWYVQGNAQLGDLSKDLQFTADYIDVSRLWVQPQATITSWQPVSDRDLFLCYNRVVRPHRLLLVTQLMSTGLVDRGLVSWHGLDCYDAEGTIGSLGRPDLLPEVQQLINTTPWELDKGFAQALDFPIEHGTQTFLNLVSETETASNCMHLTEKTYRPLAYGHPFLMLASPGQLATLRARGYHTFDRWWDESYDSDPDLDRRVRAIISILQDLSQLSRQQLVHMRYEMQDTLRHNLDIFTKSSTDTQRANGYIGLVYEAVHRIWQSF